MWDCHQACAVKRGREKKNLLGGKTYHHSSSRWCYVTRCPFHKAGLVKTESVNPEIRETEFSVSQREVTQTRERRITLACFTERGNLNSQSVTVVTDSMNLTWSRPCFCQWTSSFSLFPPSFSHTRDLISSFIQSVGKFWQSIVQPSVILKNC